MDDEVNVVERVRRNDGPRVDLPTEDRPDPQTNRLQIDRADAAPIIEFRIETPGTLGPDVIVGGESELPVEPGEPSVLLEIEVLLGRRALDPVLLTRTLPILNASADAEGALVLLR